MFSIAGAKDSLVRDFYLLKGLKLLPASAENAISAGDFPCESDRMIGSARLKGK
jgi:hypothetical protein